MSALIVRSVVFNILFYINLVLHLLGTVPAMVLPRRAMAEVAKSWGRTNNWLMAAVLDLRIEYVGLEKIPPGPLIVASKHQSMWETFALMPLFSDPAFILKRELMWLPFFGWSLWKARMIPVDRGKGSAALQAMTRRAAHEIRGGRQLIIFPEGTRRAPGAEPKYKFGVAHLYAEIGVPCLPVALNSGVFWGRRTFLRYPGTIRVEMLDPIEPGLDKQVFFDRLQTVTEAATARLVAEGRKDIARILPGVAEPAA